MNGLHAINDDLAANLMHDVPFSDWGGVIAARKLFGAELNGMLDELTEALAA
jgi:type I restriction enzyme R subunit